VNASRRRTRGPLGDRGAALVEFCLLGVVLTVPVVYLIVVAATVQRAAFAVTAAVRDAGRAYVTAGSDPLGRRRAMLAAQVALRGAHVAWSAADLVISCSPGPCSYAPGSAVTVQLAVPVPLPGLPQLLCGHDCRAGIPVRARHTELIDCYAPTGVSPVPARC
jgi:Flp pilus assembly protein TadG